VDDEEILCNLLNSCGDAQPVVVDDSQPWADDSQPLESMDDEYEELGDEELSSAPTATFDPYVV
jgi:hypothetical protein